MEYSWISVPESSSLEHKSRWAQLSDHLFAGLRHVLLVVEQNPIIKNGPLVDQVEWPINSEYSHQHRKKTVIKYTAGINESITSAITQQLSTEVISKVNASLGAGKILAATLAAELQGKVNTQLTESLSQGLSITRTFETQEENEITQTLKFSVPKGTAKGDTRNINIYNKVKEIRWDVYLYQSDYLQLEYHKNWIWKDVRKTIKQDNAQLKKPLFSIIFYEPIPSPSYGFDNYVPDVPTVTEINIEELAKQCPAKSVPALSSLEQLAKLAFPITKAEKNEVKRRLESQKKPVKKAAKKKTTKKSSPKKTAKKK